MWSILIILNKLTYLTYAAQEVLPTVFSLGIKKIGLPLLQKHDFSEIVLRVDQG